MCLESSQWRLQLFLKPHLNQTFAQEIMGFQSYKSPNFGNFGIPNLGVLGQKWHLGAGPMAKHREYYKGEGDGFA
jgi:hypothetical protein